MEKYFTKNDLQTGHIVVTKAQGNAILIGNMFKMVDGIESRVVLADLGSYNLDLTHENLESFNIEKVYKIVDGWGYTLSEIVGKLPPSKVELIWGREKEIDWTKVPKFTRVQVRDRDTEEWKNKYFIEYVEKDDGYHPYSVTGCGEFTYQGKTIDISIWKQIRIYDKSDIKEEWYK